MYFGQVHVTSIFNETFSLYKNWLASRKYNFLIFNRYPWAKVILQKAKISISKQKKKSTKTWVYIYFFIFFIFFIDHIFVYMKLWFIPSRLVMWKLWTILFFRQSKHLLTKITYRIHFWIQFLQFKKKKCKTRLNFLARTISPLKLLCFNPS